MKLIENKFCFDINKNKIKGGLEKCIPSFQIVATYPVLKDCLHHQKDKCTSILMIWFIKLKNYRIEAWNHDYILIIVKTSEPYNVTNNCV